jgi:acyl-coenzyme A thioesterase PaaI-like protein
MPADNTAFLRTEYLPEHGYCFVCGTQNPHSIGIRWQVGYLQEAPTEEAPFPPGALHIFADFSFTIHQQGPPGHAHGGASAAVMDEAMGASVWQSGYQALLAHYELDYKLPVPLNTPLRVVALVERVDGRKVYARSQLLLPDGQVAVEGAGLYLHIPGFFDAHPYHDHE